MNISDLISTLEKIRAVHGNLPVYIYSDIWNQETEMEEGSIILKSGADKTKDYWLRPADDSPVWKKRVIISD